MNPTSLLKLKKNIASLVIAVLMVISARPDLIMVRSGAAVRDANDFTEITGEEISEAVSYSHYLSVLGHVEGTAVPEAENIVISYDVLVGGTGDFTAEDESVLINEEGHLTFDFSGHEGLFSMLIDYDPVPGRSRDVELGIRMGGKLLYKETGNLVLPRRWRDAADVFETDSNDNDIRPSQKEITFDERGWLDYIAYDSSGYHQFPLLFQLDVRNSITIYASRESVRIHQIVFFTPDEIPAYRDYISLCPDVPDAEASLPVIEAEIPSWKNDATLVASADRISPVTSPNKGAKISLNMIGGQSWSAPGQEIAWKFIPEQTGMYEIRLRSRQNHTRGFYSTRTLKINGEIPFAEAQYLRFTYDRNWQIYTVSADDVPCKFYFEKDREYTLSLTMILGDFGEVLGKTQESIEVLTGIFRELIMIMGSTPDTLRDYNLDEQIPDTIAEMLIQADDLDDIAAQIRSIAGFSGGELATLRKVSDQLRDFHKDPREIAKRLRYFKDNIAALNTWMLDAKNLPVDIDYISIASPGSVSPKADAGFFEMSLYMIRMFIASFFENYNLLTGSSEDSDTELVVWSTSGRDQASILNDMIRSDYSPATKERFGKTIGVNLQLVQPDAILPAVAAGNGPDVLMNAGTQIPVNYATRNAAVNIYDAADRKEIEQVLSRFRPSALVPLEFNGGLYGLPEQETYPLIFYRTDILSQLGIPYPTLSDPWSWEDIIRYLPILQKKNMTFLMDTGTSANADVGLAMTTYAMFVLQRGGSFYKDDGIATDLDNEIAVEAFKYWTRFYTSYGLPTNFDIANRFRTGISPVVISNMALYNQLMVSAPEIKGLWQMALVPGTVKEDGSLDHSVRSSVSAVMILKSSADTGAGWDYLKWWTDTDTQVTFSREMESLLGTSARYPTANVEAMSLLPWSLRDHRVLDAQAKWARGIPEVPGGYYIPRHINNAFRAVCIKENGDEPRETILNYSRVINDELYDKRTEFGLPTMKR